MSPRRDAVRNHERLLHEAARLFAEAETPAHVTTDAIASAAGVGKGTVFRRFTDRAGMVNAVYAHAMSPIQLEVNDIAARTDQPPAQRVADILVCIANFKLDNPTLIAAVERLSDAANVFSSDSWQWLIGTLVPLIIGCETQIDPHWIAHALAAQVRADLLIHLRTQSNDNAELIDSLRRFAIATLQ